MLKLFNNNYNYLFIIYVLNHLILKNRFDMTNHLTNFPFIIKFLSLDHKEICKLSKIDFKYYGSFFFILSAK